jgi:hypothetical protein
MNFAVMAWYFRRLAPEWDMQRLFSDSAAENVHIDAPNLIEPDAVKTLQLNVSSLGIGEDVYLKRPLRIGTKEIRLLELLPYFEGNQPVCKLNVVDLQEKPIYNVSPYADLFIGNH